LLKFAVVVDDLETRGKIKHLGWPIVESSLDVS
jgi:hypothetical protein